MVSDTHDVYVHVARFKLANLFSKSRTIVKWFLEETRADICFLKFVHALFCSRFLLYFKWKIEMCRMEEVFRYFLFFFRYFIFKILIGSFLFLK